MNTGSASSPMPEDLPPVSKVYQDQMTSLSRGLALWDPNPHKEIYEKVSIGDVGYIHEGSFIRMFNVMLPWGHESNRTLGEPEPYESLDCGPFANTFKRQFDSVKHYTHHVSVLGAGSSGQDMTRDNVELVTYKFRNCGALLSLPNGGHHEDVIRAQVFEDYIKDHVASWFTWAQKNRLGIELMEELILVSGCTLVTSWAAATFVTVDDTPDAEISLASRTLNNGGANFVWAVIRGRVLYHNSRFEPNSIMNQDQCVFIRGFRVKDDKMQVIRVSESCVPEVGRILENDDPNIGVVDTISSLDTVVPINHENPQLLPYPSSTTLQSNGSVCNTSFMTSPSYISSIASFVSPKLDIKIPRTLPKPIPMLRIRKPSFHQGSSGQQAQGTVPRSRKFAITSLPRESRPSSSGAILLQSPLSNNVRFRILVIGKRKCGKSSLINATFRANMSAAPGIGSDINLAFHPDDNHRLIVHEYSGFEPGDSQSLRTVRDFITNRTDPNRPRAERLHAIWICIPTSDAIGGDIGEGVGEILNMRRVPVVVAFTKSDLGFPHISGSEGGYYQYHSRNRTTGRAYAQCEQLCLSLFHSEASDVPAELVSVMPIYGALINNLIVTTDRYMMGWGSSPSSRWYLKRASPQARISPAPLAWSVALRAFRDINIQASIEIGRCRYWRSLQSSLEFTDQALKSWVNIIHAEIVEIWNLFDTTRYLSSNQFKINMSHIVKDLAIPAGDATLIDWNVSGDELADWVDDVYRASQENVRCLMGYIVDLTVILDGIFGTNGSDVTEDVCLKSAVTYVRSGHRDRIHRDIRCFLTETFSILVAFEKDLVFEKTIDLIRQYCDMRNS